MVQYDSDILNEIARHLEILRIRWKSIRGRSGLLSGIGIFLSGGVLLSLVEGVFWFPVNVRVILVCLLTAGVIFFILKGAYHFYSMLADKKNPTDITISEWVGAKLPEIRDRLRNVLQLLADENPDKENYSPTLKDEALKEIAKDFLKADTSDVISPNPLKKSLRFAALSAFTLFLLVIPISRDGAHRLSHPFTPFQKPLPFALFVQPGDITAIEGDTLHFTARSQGGYPREVTFHYHYLSSPEGVEELRTVPMGRDLTYSLEMPSVSTSFEYKASSGRVESARHMVEVKKPPMVRKFRIKLLPPLYSGIRALQLEDNVGDFLALPGTEVEFSLQARGELSRAFIAWKDGDIRHDTLELRTTGSEAQGTMKIFDSGNYTIRLIDPDGLMNRWPIDYRADVLHDLPPMVEIVQPGDDLELAGTGILKLLLEAEDDFGLSGMRLYHRVTSEFSPDSAEEFLRLPLRYRMDPDGVFRSEYLWPLDELQLIPGDIVEYFARAWDNDDVNGPKAAETRIYTMRLPTMVELYDEVEQSEAEGMEKIEEALEASREINENIEKAINEMRRKGDLDWSQKRDLQEDMKSQRELLEKLEEASEAIEDMLNRAEESSLMSMELVEKYSELQKLMSEIASPELRKAMERLSEALEGIDPEKLRQAAEMFQLSQQEMLERIEKWLDIMKQLKLERQLEELAELIEEMAERQENIADELPNAAENDLAELARKEQLLENDMESWLDKLEETEKLAAEMDSTAGSELGEIGEQSESLPEEMEQVAGQMLSNQTESARQGGEKIGRKLRQLSERISGVKKNLIQRQKEQLAKEMLSAVRDLVSISQQQESLKGESEKISERSARFREQTSLQSGIFEGMEKVTDRLFELSQKSFFITPDIGQSLGRAAGMMNSALDNYTSRHPRKVTPQQNSAMEAINRASVKIMDAISRMQGSESATGFAELMEMMKEMSNQQAGLNQQTLSMPMPMPGEGEMSMEQMAAMGRLAAEQRALQKAMQEAAQMAEEVGGVMGELGNIADNMGEAADSLEDRNVGERTLKLQERILSRLLDAQKSVRTQRVSRERRSKTGEDMTRRSPGEIPQDTLEEMLRRDILRAMKEGYSPDYQRLIREYFRALYGREK